MVTKLNNLQKEFAKPLYFVFNKRRPCAVFCFTRESKCIYSVFSSYAFQCLWCFVHGQRQRTKEIEKKAYNKETGRVSEPVCCINYSKVYFFPSQSDSESLRALVNAVDHNGFTPLLQACETYGSSSRLQMVCYLLVLYNSTFQSLYVHCSVYSLF